MENVMPPPAVVVMIALSRRKHIKVAFGTLEINGCTGRQNKEKQEDLRGLI